MINLFRVLVVISYVSYVLFFWLPDFDYYIHDQDTIEILGLSGFGALLPLNALCGYLFFAGYTVILLGLLFFKSWARPAFIIITICSMVSTTIQGVQILPALESTLAYISNLVDGATMVIMYFTSVSSRFNKNA
jgi:hypothetical protein